MRVCVFGGYVFDVGLKLNLERTSHICGVPQLCEATRMRVSLNARPLLPWSSIGNQKKAGHLER